MSDENRAGGAADVLWTAWTSGEQIAALPDDVRPRDDAEGFAAQLALGGHAGRSYGWKIAATTTAGQAHIGVSGPLPGRLFEAPAISLTLCHPPTRRRNQRSPPRSK